MPAVPLGPEVAVTADAGAVRDSPSRIGRPSVETAIPSATTSAGPSTASAPPCGSVAAILLAAADGIAAHAFAPTQLPVGAITVSLGGLYLTLSILLRRR